MERVLKNKSVKKDSVGAPGGAQLVKHLAQVMISRDLAVPEFEPCIRLCVDGAKPAWGSVSPLCPSPVCARSKQTTSKLKKNVGINLLNVKLGNIHWVISVTSSPDTVYILWTKIVSMITVARVVK